MPVQTFQYFIPVGSTSVSITAAFFGAGGVTLDVETKTQQLTYLTPGTGFTGPEAAIAPIGVSGATGYDCNAIARWDVVPWQVPTDEFMVGVVAYHREGIDKVQFALNGGPWVDVNEMSMNHRTNEMEFCAALKLTSIPNENIEVRARVIPTVGIPRILAGGATAAATSGAGITGGITGPLLLSGNHSMFLQSAGTTRPEFFVSPNGSDSTGLSGGFSAGTRQNPYQTIPYALWNGVGGGGPQYTDVSGSILTLLPGDYFYDIPYIFSNRLNTLNGWLTIRGDASEPSAATRFTGYTASSGTRKIHIQNMQFVQPGTTVAPDPVGANAFKGAGVNGNNKGGDTSLWLDNCDLQGGFVPTNMLASYSNKWATDCTAVDIKDAPFGNRITRNCNLDGVLADSFGREDLLLSSSVKRISRDQTAAGNSGSANPYHPDIWSKFSIIDGESGPSGEHRLLDNYIVRGLTAVDRVQSQGLFFNGGDMNATYADIAMVNVNINNSSVYNATEDSWTTGISGGMCCLCMYWPMKHFLLYDSSMWKSTAIGNGHWAAGATLTDVVFKNNIGLDPINFSHGTNLLLPTPDGLVKAGTPGEQGGTWRGATLDPLPWTSPAGPTGTNILYFSGPDVTKTRESFTTLQDAITAMDVGTSTTLDLTGRIFNPTAGEVAAATDRISNSIMNFKNVGITLANATFYGGVALTWSSPDGNGIINADLTPNYNAAQGTTFEGVEKLYDPDSTEIPHMSVYPAPPTGMKYAPATYAESTWISIRGGVTAGGVVHTDAGDDASGATITGFTVTDADTITAINLGVTNGIEDLTIMMRAGPNVIYYAPIDSWDSSTNKMTFTTTAYYPNYFSVCFTGSPVWNTEAGHFCMRRSDNKVYYKPSSETTGANALVGSLPAMFSNRYGSTNNINFTNCNFFAIGGTAVETEGGTNHDTTFKNCVLRTGGNGFYGVNTNVKAYDTVFDSMRARGIAASEGTIIERCRFLRNEKSSGALIQCSPYLGATAPILQTIFRDNFCNLQEANHGQGISLYSGSWQNAIVEHNIFVCRRAHSYQAHSAYGAPTRLARGGVYKFENNLVIHDDNPDPLGVGGQPTVSFNSGPYPGGTTDSDYDVEVFIRNNTVMTKTGQGQPINYFKDYTLDILGMQYTMRYVTDNIAGRFISASAYDANLNPNQRATETANNLWTIGGWNQSTNVNTGSTDVQVDVTTGWSGDQEDYYDWPNLTPLAGGMTHASDGGKVGHRWNGGITLGTALNPPTDWYTTYSAQTLPSLPATIPYW